MEQYRDQSLARLYQHHLASAPVDYMAAIFSGMTGSDETGKQLALEFYGLIYLLYSIYDGGAAREQVMALLDAHIGRFIRQVEDDQRKKDAKK